jgi:hypothetical protein
MAPSIFLIDGDNTLTELRQTPYDSEDILQRLLADHPSVLGVAGQSGRPPLLIKREFGVPETQDGAGRWSLDHLFVDHDGVLVLVEVKRGDDTPSRRQVVAQMLDYAANGVAYWSISRLTEDFVERVQKAGKEPELELTEFLGDQEPDAFWRQVEANLRAGRIRMVFVADRIPPELRRIIEFLNEQMRPAEVLGVEVEQFLNSGGLRTLVPKLVGDTQRAQAGKSVQVAGGPASEDDLLNGLITEDRAGADRLLNWLRQAGLNVGLPVGRKSILVQTRAANGKFADILSLDIAGRVWPNIAGLLNFPPFQDESARQSFLSGLRSIPALGLSPAPQYPSFHAKALVQDAPWNGLQKLINDIVGRLSMGA